MVIFFKTSVQNIIAVQADHSFSADETKKLSWLFDNAELLPDSTLKGSTVVGKLCVSAFNEMTVLISLIMK